MCFNRKLFIGVAILAICALCVPAVLAKTALDPTTIEKYVIPLVIPPVMKTGTQDADAAVDYQIAVRQFQQQILPGGIWKTLNPAIINPLPATTVWSYGPDADTPPLIAPVPAATSQFNYPAFTIEATVNGPVDVDWINDLKDPTTGDFLPYLIPGVVDQTLHWANPVADCISGALRTDCRGDSQDAYDGPNPIITHVHGAHVGPESDGYPEAWYLPDPAGSNFTCVPRNLDGSAPALGSGQYICEGTIANKYGGTPNTANGVANFSYPNDQPSTTLWYHDHTLGMTRLNVYAGPAGYWLIREEGGGETGLNEATDTLPGPAPVVGEDPNFDVPAGTRAKIREIPIVIQDRSFNTDGSLFYPKNRAFFEGLGDGQTSSVPGNTGAGLNIDFVPTDDSDISPIWNPEAFFNVMVVNGVSWPQLEVAPAIYRFRLLNGCNSRFLNLSMSRLNKRGRPNKEIPFYQIGAEQSLLPQVVEIVTGKATPLIPGNATWDRVNGPFKDQALLMGLAERADVLVDFRGLKNGTIIRMFNTAPDAPFGGFPDVPADPATTGQVMQFRVNSALLGTSPTDPGGASPATDPWNLALSPVENVDTYPTVIDAVQDLALLEEESAVVCVFVNPDGTIDQDPDAIVDPNVPGQCLVDPEPPAGPTVALSVPFAPKAAVLGVNGSLGGTVQLWSDPIAQNPGLGSTETWELWNWSADAHPIHLHLVKFKVLDREPFDLAGVLLGPVPPEADETGWKDTVIAYPGEVTRVAATFDREGLYVWHCHIVEHEDNEMMVPYCVGDPNANGCADL